MNLKQFRELTKDFPEYADITLALVDTDNEDITSGVINDIHLFQDEGGFHLHLMGNAT